MRVQFVLVCMLILGASAASPASATMSAMPSGGQSSGQFGVQPAGQPASVDVLGSSVNNTTIMLPPGTSIGVDIVGSSASNIQIGYEQPAEKEPGNKKCDGCGACGEKKCYNTVWDDFARPLCYPWSSYIPTRYNRPFVKPQPGQLCSGSN